LPVPYPPELDGFVWEEGGTEGGTEGGKEGGSGVSGAGCREGKAFLLMGTRRGGCCLVRLMKEGDTLYVNLFFSRDKSKE